MAIGVAAAATLLLFLVLGVAKGTPNTSVKLTDCNPNSYQNGDPFGDSVAHVIPDLENVTPNTPGFIYYTQSPYSPIAYGFASCNAANTGGDCNYCLMAARDAMFGNCVNRYGAHLVLADCELRYEQYSLR